MPLKIRAASNNIYRDLGFTEAGIDGLVQMLGHIVIGVGFVLKPRN